MSNSQKLSYITLLCKDENQSDNMKFYRPISLLNTDRKILSKILTTRLGHILPKIIGISQTCSVKGRTIFDNNHLHRNIMDYIEQKQLPVIFISLDQEKAFDRVSHSYMYDTLTAFGFDDAFIRWVKVLYEDVKSSVIVNNFISETLDIQRGVRQGCSLSMLLYVICFEPLAKRVQDDTNIKGIKVPGSDFEVKLSLYADDNTGFFTSGLSVKKYFDYIEIFQKISGSKINYRKSNGMYLGKWNNRSDHAFGISWINKTKLLGYHYGHFDISEVWQNIFIKFDKTLKLWQSRRLSFKGKSVVLNSLAFSKILYYVTAGLLPKHYLTLLQRSCFRFIWTKTYEPVARDTLYLPFSEGGLNIPNIQLKCDAIYMTHLSKLVNGHDAIWTYFAKYWIGLQLRKHNSNLFKNNSPHSVYVPAFYKHCLEVYYKLVKIYPTFDFRNGTSKLYYTALLSMTNHKPRNNNIFPNINFREVYKNLYNHSIDSETRNTCWRISHDVVYVNYFLFTKGISKSKTCLFCDSIETVTHLFIYCKTVQPLNKIILKILNHITNQKFQLTEDMFRFLLLPNTLVDVQEIALILLSESRNIIWNSRNKCKHEQKPVTAYSLVAKFLSKIKFRMSVDLFRMGAANFSNFWQNPSLCTILVDTHETIITYDPILNIETYFSPVSN